MDLGCDPVRAFVAVTLPLIWPAIAAGWMLAFTLSLDDLVIASFTTGPGSATLPIRIYSEVRLGVKPEINAICTLIIGLIAVRDRGGVAGVETVERARRERRAVVDAAATASQFARSVLHRAGAARLPAHRRLRPALRRGAGFWPPPVKRSITERTASRVLRSFTASSSGAERRRAADQAFRIGKDQRIVPRSLDHERQIEAGRRVRRRGQAGDALQVVFARRHRGGAGQRQARGRAFDADVLGGGDAVAEFHRDGQGVERRRAGAEIAAAGQRPALQPLQQLLDIEAGDRAVMAGQGGGAVERLREAERARCPRLPARR